MREFDLHDLIWVVGGVLAFMAAMFAYTYVPWRALWAHFIMSSDRGQDGAESAVAASLPATSTDGRQGVAKPGNAVNAELPGNALPEAARDIVRFQAKVEAVIAIVESGKVGQVEAIERIFGVKRSGRTDSPYARARAAVEAQAKTGPTFRPLTDEQQQLRADLQLDQR